MTPPLPLAEGRCIQGANAVAAALARGEPLRWILVDEEADAAAARRLAEPALAAGVPFQSVGTRHFARLAPHGARGGALALRGEPPARDLAGMLARPGPAWLLVGVRYPGNAGVAIRTAEVSGAAGVALDVPYRHEGRREALRASMRADRFLPVVWEESDAVLAAARAAGRRIVAVEDSGTLAPWESDLTGPLLFAVGGESEGLPEAVLAASDAVVRIPMAGSLRSYNLQAALAMVAGERMRQQAGLP